MTKNNFNEFVVIILVFCFSLFSQATSTDVKPVASTSGSNINSSADTAKKANDKTSAVSQIVGVANMGLGAMYMARFSSSCPKCDMGALAQAILHFAMGAQSFQQAKANNQTAGVAGMSYNDSSSENPYGKLGLETNYLDPSTNVDPALKELINTRSFMDTKNALTSKGGLNGVKMDPLTGVITTPDGKKYDPNALADKEAMSKAGFSDAVIDGAFAANASFEKEAIKKVGGIESFGSASAATNGYQEGGGGSTASSSSTSSNGYGSSSSRTPASGNKIAGLTKNFNGEKIGVAAENIFSMMSRRFKVMEKRDAFFDPSELIPLTQ